jgi:hypothetical protein
MPSLKRMIAIIVLLGPPVSWRSLGQEQSMQKIIFHVTAVRSEEARDICASDSDCDATRFTVEGYSDPKGGSSPTEYTLDCVEIMSLTPPPHYLVVCDRVHAHNDYSARLMSNAIAFGEAKPRSSDGPGVSAYRILSEREASKKKS